MIAARDTGFIPIATFAEAVARAVSAPNWRAWTPRCFAGSVAVDLHRSAFAGSIVPSASAVIRPVARAFATAVWLTPRCAAYWRFESPIPVFSPTSNPAQGVRIIKSSRIDHKAPVPSKDAIRALIEAAGEDLKPHLIVSALGGLRASELRGLRWQDVDFDKGFLHIRQRADAYNQIGEPKSRAGFRDIPAGPMVLNALRRWKLRCPKGDLGLVFPAPQGGILQHTRTQNRFRKLQETVGVTLRWHDLRHFAVSLWIEQGFSIKEIMTFAGHSSIQMTMERYGHLFPSPDHQKAMAMVEAKLLG